MNRVRLAEERKLISKPMITDERPYILFDDNSIWYRDGSVPFDNPNEAMEKITELEVEEYIPDDDDTDYKKPVPGKKDLTIDEAGAIAVNELKRIYNMDGNGRVTLSFSDQIGSIPKRAFWSGTFYPSNNHVEYRFSIDSVTGGLYEIHKYDDSFTKDGLNYIVQNESSELRRYEKNAYIDSACTFIQSAFPNKAVVSSQYLYTGLVGKSHTKITPTLAYNVFHLTETEDAVLFPKVQITDKNQEVVNPFMDTKITVYTAHSFSDGTGCMIALGLETYEALSVAFYPNGVEDLLTAPATHTD